MYLELLIEKDKIEKRLNTINSIIDKMCCSCGTEEDLVKIGDNKYCNHCADIGTKFLPLVRFTKDLKKIKYWMFMEVKRADLNYIYYYKHYMTREYLSINLNGYVCNVIGEKANNKLQEKAKLNIDSLYEEFVMSED